MRYGSLAIPDTTYLTSLTGAYDCDSNRSSVVLPLYPIHRLLADSVRSDRAHGGTKLAAGNDGSGCSFRIYAMLGGRLKRRAWIMLVKGQNPKDLVDTYRLYRPIAHLSAVWDCISPLWTRYTRYRSVRRWAKGSEPKRNQRKRRFSRAVLLKQANNRNR